jgi:acylphosphatase
MPAKRLTLQIAGLVQGVGYRYSAQGEARKRGLTGYVKNTAAGGIELVAEGEEPDLKDFSRWCYNGVSSAIVQKVIESWSEAAGDFSDFVIRF